MHDWHDFGFRGSQRHLPFSTFLGSGFAANDSNFRVPKDVQSMGNSEEIYAAKYRNYLHPSVPSKFELVLKLVQFVFWFCLNHGFIPVLDAWQKFQLQIHCLTVDFVSANICCALHSGRWQP